MPSFSKSSAHKLDTCAYTLQRLFNKVIQYYDCKVIDGHRTEEDQDKAYNTGHSKVKYPNSKHNSSPSNAADVAPYISGCGIPWPKMPHAIGMMSASERAEFNAYVKDMQQFAHFAGYVQGMADHMGMEITNGGDWDRDHCLSDQTFDDWPHFQVK